MKKFGRVGLESQWLHCRETVDSCKNTRCFRDSKRYRKRITLQLPDTLIGENWRRGGSLCSEWPGEQPERSLGGSGLLVVVKSQYFCPEHSCGHWGCNDALQCVAKIPHAAGIAAFPTLFHLTFRMHFLFSSPSSTGG